MTAGDQRWHFVRQRAIAARNRPSALAAKEFCRNTDWQTLPARLGRLVTILNTTTVSTSSQCSLSIPIESSNEIQRQQFTACILASCKLPNFHSGFEQLFLHSLQNRCSHYENDEMDTSEDGDKTEEWFQHLRRLKWLKRELLKPLNDALRSTILDKVRMTIKGEFEESHIMGGLEQWIEAVVIPWIRDLSGEEYEESYWKQQVSFDLSQCFCLIRMEEIFNIVAEYPDSLGAVMELSRVLHDAKMHRDFADALQTSLTKRLLHPGANTSQIIDVYISTIKVLRHIDPSDQLLATVAEPVRVYLRGRKDTVRCIITSMTDCEGDLYEELSRQDAKPLEDAQVDSDDEEEPPTMEWMPPPPLCKQRGTFFGPHNKSNTLDILSMLVSIYGSKELFVEEYRVMLADKLLANLDFDTEKEVHTLELLKLRFGEASMRQCEIMIKDIDDSKRTVSNIVSILEEQKVSHGAQPVQPSPAVDAAIISHIFWPSLQDESMQHHPRIQTLMNEFSGGYKRIKLPRQLVWLQQLGTVQLELDVIEDGNCDGVPVIATREFSVSPMLASLISHFEDGDRWTAEQLSTKTGIAEHIVRKKMAYWVNNRVLTSPAPHTYEIAMLSAFVEPSSDDTVTDQPMEMGHGDNHDDVTYTARAATLSSTGDRGEVSAELLKIESYVIAMLQRLHELPLDRIHSNLKNFATSPSSEHKYSLTKRQLSIFLQRLCKEGKLVCELGSIYKLSKKR